MFGGRMQLSFEKRMQLSFKRRTRFSFRGFRLNATPSSEGGRPRQGQTTLPLAIASG